EGLRAFMESLLVSDETAATDRGALEWAMRLTGGGGAISFDSRGDTRASSGVDPDFAEELQELLPNLANGIRRYERRSGQTVTLIALPIHSIEGIGRLVVVSGPFTPAIGNDEMNRVQQFMTSVTAGVDRRRLVKELKDANRELKDASEHKSVFLANMSHELRTPLNAIIGFSELMLDAGKLKQMLLNLISNAIKFTAEGGTVKISARRLQGAIEIAVADTGIGISDADQAKIFMEFHQVDPGPGRRQQGTGLGLALTR